MIEQMSFIGIPLDTQVQRRRLVILYYLLLFALTVLVLWRPHPGIPVMIIQTIFLGGLLGGIRVGGPVKLYDEPGLLEGGEPDAMTTLNLNGKERLVRVTSPLDERERHERDHAHYLAYKVLRWTVMTGVLALAVVSTFAPWWLAGRSGALLWAFVIYLLSLPQSVVLWTEPSAPRADLIEMPVLGH